MICFKTLSYGLHSQEQQMIKPQTDSYANVWDAIPDTPEEAANLRLHSELMEKITALIQKNGWAQFEATKHCSVT